MRKRAQKRGGILERKMRKGAKEMKKKEQKRW